MAAPRKLPKAKFGLVAKLRGLDLIGIYQTTFFSLQIRDFRLLWLSTSLSFSAMQMQWVARSWLVYEITQSPMALAWITVSVVIPMTILAPVGGAITDRVPKRNLLGATMGGSTIIALSVALLIHLEQIAFWHLLVSGVASAMIISFNMPGRYSFIPQVVGDEKLVNATALTNASMNLSRILAPALAGGLIILVETAGVYDFIAGLYVFGAVVVLMMHQKGSALGRSDNSVASDILDGLRYVWGNKVVRVLVLVALLPQLFGFPFMLLLPAFAVESLGLGPGGYGVLLATVGGGAIVGSLVVAYLGNFERMGLCLCIFYLVWGVSLGWFSQTTSLATAAVPVLLVGMSSTMFMALHLPLIQMYTAPEMRGRVMSIFLWTASLLPIGLLPMGAIAERNGTDTAYLFSAAVLLIGMTVVFLLAPTIRNLKPVSYGGVPVAHASPQQSGAERDAQQRERGS